MANVHLQSIRYANQTTRVLGVLFARFLGNAQRHPRGRILSAYRQARKALSGATAAARRQILAEMQAKVQAALLEAVREAVDIGLSQAEKEASNHGLPLPSGSLPPNAQQQAVSNVMAAVEQQIAAALSGLLDDSRLLGSSSRSVGLFAPSGRHLVVYLCMGRLWGRMNSFTRPKHRLLLPTRTERPFTITAGRPLRWCGRWMLMTS